METNDTIKLLQECDAGSKMGVKTIDEVIDCVTDDYFKSILIHSKDHHKKLGNDIHSLLNQMGAEEKDPSAIASGMAWMKTNMKIEMNHTDQTIAELMVDGCDMGIKSLYKYLHEYEGASHEAKEYCKRLIIIEDELRREMYPHL